MEDISSGSLILMGIALLIISGSLAVILLPEVLSFECLTPDDTWFEDGVLHQGYMVNC